MSTTSVITCSLIISSITAILSNSWLIIWVIMEVNTLSFCSTINIENNGNNTNQNESILNYLIIQSIASAILISSITLNKIPINNEEILSSLGVLSLITNIAASPLHQWFINIVNNISWFNNIILFSWQKIIPTFFLIFQPNNIAFPFIIASAIIGAFFIFNNNSINEIIGFSSVFNISWSISAISVSTNNIFLFFFIYWIGISYAISNIAIGHVSSLTESNNQISNKSILFLSIINLAGLPPFMIFLANWYTFTNLINTNIIAISVFITTLSSVGLFSYVRIINNTTINNSSNAQKFQTNNNNIIDTAFITTSIIILILFI